MVCGSVIRSVDRDLGRLDLLEPFQHHTIVRQDLFADVDKAPKMLAKGKLPLLPNRSGSARDVRRVFQRAEEEAKR